LLILGILYLKNGGGWRRSNAVDCVVYLGLGTLVYYAP
jgi:hypothetical protein